MRSSTDKKFIYRKLRARQHLRHKNCPGLTAWLTTQVYLSSIIHNVVDTVLTVAYGHARGKKCFEWEP